MVALKGRPFVYPEARHVGRSPLSGKPKGFRVGHSRLADAKPSRRRQIRGRLAEQRLLLPEFRPPRMVSNL
jgi:hypothetical protein